MKTAIFQDSQLAARLRKMGRKTRSHGSCRAKRKPNSKRVQVASVNAQYNRKY